ncbi:MAG: AgmX/PglI C-terminal domain-containing protein [Labilithrix sp.]|nr:AgmX/PglI C-terminal domain-containing protein [Labilithrix sp.]
MTTHAFAPTFDVANMFAPAQPISEVDVDADDTQTSFALIKNGPPVPADEVESHVDAVEVTVRWGTQVLSVTHLENGESFCVGEGADLALPEDVLGAGRAPIVIARGAGAYVVVPQKARGSVSMKGESESLVSMIARNALARSGEVANAFELALQHGMAVTLELGGERADGTIGEPVTFEIGTVRAGKVAPIGFLATLAGGATGMIGLSFLGHAAIVASLAMFMPKMTDDGDGVDREQIVMMQKFLNASAQRELDEPKPQPGPTDESQGGGSIGEAHKNESGVSGTSKPVTTNGHSGFKGADDKSELSKKEERALAEKFGMIGLLATSSMDPNAPASPWATEYHGSDDKSAWGKMYGQSIDDSFGGGLGLWGTGEGGGGEGKGIGVDRVGTVGGGGGGPGKWGIGKGDKDGMGNGHGPGNGGHVAKAPQLRNPTIDTNGRLPAEVIQRIVRQNFGRFRLCYEAGLRGNPALSGRVSTKFVIGRDGAVNQASDAGSDLPDQQVVACIVRSFNSLSFPSPEGGVATVTYPIVLTPGE